MDEYIKTGESILLYGESNGRTFQRTFTITGENNRGGSVLCYSAQYDRSGTGVLKEFCPHLAEGITRNENNYLVLGSDSNQKEDFKNLLHEYIKPYNMLAELRRNEELATFIPAFEIYHDSPDMGGTVYIWSPEPKAETFEKYCHDVHADYTDHPERKLLNILYAVESLTKCICSFHRCSLIHGDIKPENFGFIRRGQDTIMQAVTLFDLDTVSYIYKVCENPRCTEGFCEPEIYNMKMTNQTDIYSIGAVLFYALRSERYMYYRTVNFAEHIQRLVDTSELVKALAVDSSPIIKKILSEILQKTLCRREERYRSCEEMLTDIRKALDYLVPAEISKNDDSSVKWILEDASGAPDKKTEKNITTALQYHLYTNPLYMGISAKKNNISLLIVGFHRYSQKFLDIALQTAQMPGKILDVTVICGSPNEKASYLAERPALADFFNVDGSQSGKSDIYGNITFIVHDISREFISSLSVPDYVFIAVGSDKQNIRTAELFNGFSFPVSVALKKSRLSADTPENILPVWVDEDISASPLYKKLERMAFNAHIIWNKNLNIDLKELRSEFRKPYFYNSCISFALSVKYKLHGLGIELDGSSGETAAKYLKCINSDRKIKNELIWLEHRRWVTEKLCLGYTGITDLEECAGGKTKDEQRKRHICIIKSCPEQSLASKPWTKGSADKPNIEKWDNPDAEDLKKLDDIDRMSVELHLMYKRLADIARNEISLNGEIVSAIRMAISKDHSLNVSFQELITCMKDIWNRDIQQVSRYTGLKKSFGSNIDSSEVLDRQEKSYIKRLTASLHEKFFPIFASQQYRSYKRDDFSLVEGLPFILTYSEAFQMIIPYSSGSNDNIFSNVAAPTVINPCKIIYFAFCESADELKNIADSLPYMANYMEKRNFRAGVEFIIGCNSGLKTDDRQSISGDFEKLSSGRVKKVKFIEAERPKEFIYLFNDYLLKSRKKADFMLELNGTYLSGLAEGIGIDELFPSYSFNSKTMKFRSIHDCDAVKYLRFKPYITVPDMFALKMSTSTTSSKPEFYAEYQELWNKYSSMRGTWKHLCRLFKEHAEAHDIIAVFKQKNNRTPMEYTYTMPFGCRKTVEMILDALASQEIISDKSYINSVSTDSCQAKIFSFFDCRHDFDNLFRKPDILRTESIECDTDTRNHIVKIIYNNLYVQGFDCRNMQNASLELLEYFGRKNYFIGLSIDRTAGKASFTYSTAQIKDLLTSEGRILEVYTYHKARETGQFDDIRSGFEIDWEKVDAKNEFDCILTKGFSALFVECKATRELKWEYYTKIESLARHFGINVKIVIVADTNAQDNTENNMYCERGRQINVITISEPSEIRDIGNVLLKLLK